jgi:4-amino-4-deoxy-L-arabinose transferase-like glycosyltransferase
MTKYFLIFIVIFIPSLFLRDITPNNELRYLSIADEALNNNTFFTFYNHGIPYADKPPLYLWIVMLSKWIFNSHNLVFLELFSLLPAFIVINIMNKWTSEQISLQGRFAGALILMSMGLFTVLAISLRMDTLMTMFIVLSLNSFYQLYKNKYNLTQRILFPLWIFLAVFSKGPVGFLIPFCSTTIFLVLKKEWKSIFRFFGYFTWGILTILFSFWFLMVYLEGGSSYLNNLLFNQTVNRAIDAFTHNSPFYFYGLHIWYVLFPWSILCIGTITVQIYRKQIKSDLEKLFLTVILSTFFLLSIISSKLPVYLLPILPFIVYLSIIGIEKPEFQSTIRKLMTINVVVSFLIIPVILLLTLRYIDNQKFKNLLYIFPTLILMIFLMYESKIMKKQCFYKKITFLSLSTLIVIISLSIPVCSKLSYKQLAEEINTLSKRYQKTNTFFYKIDRGENMDVYLDSKLHKVEDTDLVLIKDREGIFFCKKTEINKNPVLEKVIEGKTFVVKGDYIIVVI